jgi:hypothetical protein
VEVLSRAKITLEARGVFFTKRSRRDRSNALGPVDFQQELVHTDVDRQQERDGPAED